MSLTRSVARNTLAQATGRFVSIALALAVFFLVARYLGVAGYGSYTTITAFLQFFGIAVDLGLYVYLAKVLGEPGVDEERMVSNVFTLRVASAVVILGLAPLLVLVFPYPAQVRVGVAVMALANFCVTATQVLAAVFQKHLRTGRFIAAEVVGRLFLLGMTAVAIRSGAGLIGIVWTVVLSSALTFGLTALWARSFGHFRLRFDAVLWRDILRVTWPIALSIVFNVVYFKADTIILSVFRTATDVGIYGAPYRVFEALISVPALFAGLLTPILSAAYATDRQRFGQLLQRGFEVLVVAAVPVVVGAQFVARNVMELIAPEFSASGPVLQILMLGTAAIFIGYLFSNAVVVVNRQRRMMWVYLFLALASVALYIPLIQRYSYYGAAAVTVLIESTVAAVSAYVVLRASRTRFTYGGVRRTALAGAIMALAMLFGRALPWYVNGALGAAVYVVVIVASGVIDRSTVREIISRT